MINKLYFDVRDVLRAPRLGLSAKKVWVQFIGMVVGLLGYAVLSYGALLLEGYKLAEIWAMFGALPIPVGLGLHWYGWVITGVGALWAVIISMLAGTATAKLTYEQLRGNDFYSKKEAWKFARKHASAVILSPIGMAIVAIVLVGGGLLIGLIAGTGAVGAWVTTAFYPIIMAVTIFTVYLLVIVKAGFLIAPAIVGTTKNDTFETIFEMFSTVSAQPWRLILYEIVLGLIAVVALGILTVFVVLALKLMYMVFGYAWGTDFTQYVFPQAGYYTFSFLKTPATLLHEATLCGVNTCIQSGALSPEVLLSIPGINWIYYLPTMTAIAIAPGAGLQVAAIIYAVWTIVLLGLVISYFFSTMYTGHALIYLILRKKKDDENLLERKDYDEEFPEFEVPEDKVEDDLVPPEATAEEAPTEEKEGE